MDILFANVDVISMEPGTAVFRDYFVGVRGGRITHFSADAPTEPAGRVVDCTGRTMLPGLHNCHAHAAMTLLRGFAADKPLEDWLFNHIFPAERRLTPDLVRVGTQLAMAEMIAGGCVSFCDMYFFMDTVAAAALEAGMLANVSNAVIGLDADTYDLHKDNVYSQTLRAVDEFHGANDNQIMVDASIHGAYTSYPRAWQQVLQMAHAHGLRMHVHLSETRAENAAVIEKFGASPAQIFAQHGVFDIPCVAGHGVWLDGDDLDIVAEHNVSIAHCPVSNLKLASGLADIVAMRARGINVALGIDGVAANNSHNMFEEIKLASILQKYLHSDALVMPAWDALTLATTAGARALGRDGSSGWLAPGRYADLVLVDMTGPAQGIVHCPIQNLVYSTSPADVCMTMCRGRILYEGGEYFTIDTERLKHDAAAARAFFV